MDEKIGGLITKDDDRETIRVGDHYYIMGNKAKNALRNTVIDWETFLEVYGKNIEKPQLFDQVFKILGIEDGEMLKKLSLPILQKIYKFSDKIHLMSMIKQYVINETMVDAVYNLFSTIKNHYETLLYSYINIRNDYIKKHNTGDQLNNPDDLKEYWTSLNDEHKLESSSIYLYFLNPKIKVDNHLFLDINCKDKKLKKYVKNLIAAVKKFYYPGFCPKVAYKRLYKLLEFPVNEFVKVIRYIDPQKNLFQYDKIENHINEIISNYNIKDPTQKMPKIKRVKCTGKTENEKIICYVNNILELRIKLVPYITQLEKFFIEHTKMLDDINNYLLSNF